LIHQRHRWTDRQTDGETDGQTTCDSKTALCTIVHRAVKKTARSRNSTAVNSFNSANCTCTLCLHVLSS